MSNRMHPGENFDTASSAAQRWQADLRRYGRRPFIRDLSIWAIAVYRFGQWNDVREAGRLSSRVGLAIYYLLHRLTELSTGITLPKEATFGPGLRIHHLGTIVIHPAVVAGANCTLRHGVTIGERKLGAGVPTLGDDVELGTYAQVLGPIHIGDRSKLGALALVVDDVSADCVVVAPKATVLPTVPKPGHT